MTASKLDRDSGEVQENTLLYTMGKEAEAMYDSFIFSDSEEERDDEDEEKESRSSSKLDYSKVMQNFSEHFGPKRNVIQDHTCFYKRVNQWKRS